MKKKNLLYFALVLMIASQFLYALRVSSQPVDIGKTVQPVPYESNPTEHVSSGVTPTTPMLAYDGFLATSAGLRYGATGSFELKTFNNTGTQFTNIGWVDFKISYKAEATATTDDRYRILYYVGTDGPVVLQNWRTGESVHRPDGDGTYTAWTGDYTKWSETTSDGDTSYVSAAANNLNETSTLSGPLSNTDWEMFMLKVSAVARKDGTSDEGFSLMLVVDGKGYNGSRFIPTASYATYSKDWDLNPVTGSPWTWDEINALEVGVRSDQVGSSWEDCELRITQLFVEVYPTFNGGAKFAPSTGLQGHRTWSNQLKPGGGSWSWADISNVRIVFETQLVGANDNKLVSIYEVWLTVYPNSVPLPPEGISVQPQFIEGLHAGTTFFVDVYVSNVVKMWQYQFMLNYDTSVLTAVSYFSYHPFNSAFPSAINDTAGWVSVSYASFGGDNRGLTGSSPIMRIYFTVDADGASSLNLNKVIAVNVYGFGIIYGDSPYDGIFATFPVHDVATIEVKTNATQVMPGAVVTVNVTVANQGTYPETSTVTAYYDSTPISSQPVTLELGATEILTFNWNTAGVPFGHYTISGAISEVSDEIDTSDNTLPDGMVIVGRHDMAVTEVIRAYPTPDVMIPKSQTLEVEKGQIVYVNVTVLNNGTFTENFNVTVSYTGGGQEQPRGISGEYNFGVEYNVPLNPSVSKNLTFAWNTSTVIFSDERWVECRIRASIVEVPYEEYTSNNIFGTKPNEANVVNVTRPPVEAAFRILTETDSRLQGQSIIFDAGTSFTIAGTEFVRFEWDFGDGTKAIFIKGVNLTTPYRWTHIFIQKGEFDVTLTVTNNDTRSDTETQSLLVKSVDVAIVNVVTSPTQVMRGEVVNINVTAANQGDFWEDINVTAYYGNTRIQTQTVQATNFKNGTSTILRFNWNTTGVTPGTYTIKANGTILAGRDVKEYEKADNEFVNSAVTILYVRDIAVTSVQASPTEVLVGGSVTIDVTVNNQGDWGAETFPVTVYYGETEIDTQTVNNLNAGSSTTLSFTWNTEGVSPNTYQIKAVATLADDNDPDDNSLVGDSVTVAAPSNIFIYLVGVGLLAAVAIAAILIYFFKVRKPKTTNVA